MNIALSRSEIATFFECDPATVERRWDRRELSRSVFVENRTNPELAHSSVFDVLEFYVKTEVLDAGHSADDVETWMCAVDELVEHDLIQRFTMEEVLVRLMEMHQDFSARGWEMERLARDALKVLAAYVSLLRFVESDAMQSVAAS